MLYTIPNLSKISSMHFKECGVVWIYDKLISLIHANISSASNYTLLGFHDNVFSAVLAVVIIFYWLLFGCL